MATELSDPRREGGLLAPRVVAPGRDCIHLPPVAVLFALRRESLFFRRGERIRSTAPVAPCEVTRRGEGPESILVLETGTGREATEAALWWLFGTPLVGGTPYRPRMVLSGGFSGALRPELAVGDLLFADEIVDDDGGRWETSWPTPCLSPPALPLVSGRLLSLGRLIADPADKRRLGRFHAAAAADMETAAIARACSQHSVPFGCVRAISDGIETALSPELTGLLRRGRVAAGAMLATVICQPEMVGELARLARDTRRAARRLSAGLEALLAAEVGQSSS